MAGAYIKKNGEILGRLSSQCMVLEAIYSDQNTISTPTVTHVCQYPINDVGYTCFSYVDSSYSSNVELFGNGKRHPVGSASAMTYYNLTDNTITVCPWYEKQKIAIFRKIMPNDAIPNNGVYFNLYNENGGLFFTLSKPPLILTNSIQLTDNQIHKIGNDNINYQLNASNLMCCLSTLGVTDFGFFRSLRTPLAFNDCIISFGQLMDFGGEGTRTYTRNVLLSRRI
ncbi:hypothetical protein F9U39_03705 [Pectobacterium versatile]|uniref:hypothetical protein n=1 Tax=Pectobacterium versatile TaxID=2488639 RepID=UPI001B37CCA1|nr:hypothetical protein [Pectobacterium versatile]MBQ4788520.1 hypothetical protein [Pectobacterium versatile]